MAINPETQYAGKIAPSSSQYPYGEARNITVPGDGTGTPWEAALVNDLFGLQQALLTEAEIVPSGNPDEVGNSQYLQALLKLFYSRVDSTLAVFGRNLSKHNGFVTLGYSSVNDGGGANWRATGNTVAGSAGTFDKASGLLYDTVGTEFEYAEKDINVLAFGAKADRDAGDTDNASVFSDVVAYAKSRATWGTKVVVPARNNGYSSSGFSITGASGLIFGGQNAIIELIAGGTEDALITVDDCVECFFVRNHFVGTSDTNAVYDAAARRAGLEVTNSSFIVAQQNTFEKFISFGIFCQNMKGGTYTEGMRIHGNVFRDVPYDSATAVQAGIILSSDGEYSIVSGNSFFRIPSAIRFDDGANSLFSENIVMQLNSEYRLDAAAVYQEVNSNSGKLQIVNNKMNHIESGQIVVFLKNDPAKPQNSCIVAENELLVNGSASGAQQIVLNDYPNSRVVNNSVRPAATVTNQECIRLNRCPGAWIDGNHLNGGDYSITVDTPGDRIKIGENQYENFATGKVLIQGGSIEVVKARTSAFRVSSAGGAGSPFDDDNVTPSQVATGHYRLTHNFGSTNYIVTIQAPDNKTGPQETSPAVVRTSTTVDIYFYDNTGTPTNESFLVSITHGRDSVYPL